MVPACRRRHPSGAEPQSLARGAVRCFAIPFLKPTRDIFSASRRNVVGQFAISVLVDSKTLRGIKSSASGVKVKTPGTSHGTVLYTGNSLSVGGGVVSKSFE